MGRPLHSSESHQPACICIHCYRQPEAPDTVPISPSSSSSQPQVPTPTRAPPITTQDNILQLVAELQQDLEQTHRSLREATQALEATFRRLINSRNTIRNGLNTMPQDFLSGTNDAPDPADTSEMRPGHSALLISPNSPSSSPDSLRILLDRVERQTFWMEDPAAPDPSTNVPTSSSSSHPRVVRPNATSFFGPRDTVRLRPPGSEPGRRLMNDNVNNASTTLGRRVAARAAAGVPRGSGTPRGDDVTRTRVAEVASNVDDTITRLRTHRQELLAASDSLRLSPSRRPRSPSPPLVVVRTPAVRSGSAGSTPVRRYYHSSLPHAMQRAFAHSSNPTTSTSTAIHTRPAFTAARSPNNATRPQDTPGASTAPGTNATEAFSDFVARTREDRNRRMSSTDSSDYRLPPSDITMMRRVPTSPVIRSSEAVIRAARRMEPLDHTSADARFDLGLEPYTPRPRGWARLDQDGNEVPADEEVEYERNRTNMRARAEDISSTLRARQLERDRQSNIIEPPSAIDRTRTRLDEAQERLRSIMRLAEYVPAGNDSRPPAQSIAESALRRHNANGGVPSGYSRAWYSTLRPTDFPHNRTVIALSDDSDDDDDDLDRVRSIARSPEMVVVPVEAEDIVPVHPEEFVPPFQVSALPLPLVRLDAPLAVGMKRTAAQGAAIKSIRVSRDCIAGR